MVPRGLIALAALTGALCAWGQKPGQVEWSLAVQPAAAAPASKILARLSARLEPGWHLYSFSTPAAIPLTAKLPDQSPLASFRVFQPKPKRAFDPNFNSDTETYEGEVTFLIEAQLRPDLPPGPAEMSLNLRYQTCSDRLCVPGKSVVTSDSLRIDSSAPPFSPFIPAGYSVPQPPQPTSAAPGDAGAVASQLNSQGLAAFLLIAFGFGLAAIFTPCVFPMVPITMSYFLNRPSGSRRESLVQAGIFCVGIIVLFSTLGLLLTAVLGPFGVVQLGSNPWVNGFISILFIAFGFSLLGAFELSIPSFILTKLDRKSQKGGFAGTLLMGLTFSLASFACVGPFVGTLLAASVGGGGSRPLIGMVTFASGLALPFFLLALFPSYLQRMPKSGGWLARVKVVMGFVILAASLKYLGSLDQVLQWGLITRGRFLAAWIVLFAMAGLYLLGFLRMEGVKADESMGLGRLLIGMAFLVFALSLLPGMFGGRLGDLDAYVPLASGEGTGPGGTGSASSLAWLKNSYKEALEKARREGKLVFVNFTGYACTNCHWMKSNMFPRPEISGALQDFVLLELYTDGTDDVSKQNQDLELARFNTVAIPFYAIIDPDEKVVATFPGLTKDPREYLAFLQKGARPASAPGTAPAPTSAAVPGATPAAAPAQAPSGGTLPQGLTRLDGTPVEALDGKVVVVNFWATWCVPCIQEIPSFNQLHRQFGRRGVAVLGVSMDEDGPEKVKSFLSKHPMEYAVAMGSEKFSRQYRLDQLPVTLVFDRTGRQVRRFEGFTPEQAVQEAVKTAL